MIQWIQFTAEAAGNKKEGKKKEASKKGVKKNPTLQRHGKITIIILKVQVNKSNYIL